jgi:6-phosphofructokinase 1
MVVSEGAYPKGGDVFVKNTKEGGEGVINVQLGGAGEFVAKEIEARTGMTARNTTLGYLQRGGTPTATDRVLSTKYGAKAMELALEGKYNVLTVLKDGKLDSIPLEEVVGNNKEIGAVEGGTEDSNMKTIKMDDDLVKTARDVGICLGD